MKEIYFRLRWAWLTAIFYLLVPLPLSAGAPTDQTRATADKVLSILTNPELKSEPKKKERRDQLRQAIYPRFDFADMAKRSLGSHWQRRTPEEQQQFQKLFTELLERSYVDAIESYNGEKIVYGREKEDKNRAEVPTKVVTKKGEEFSINYNLHLVSGEWKVYDIVIENVSLVNNYRSQFNRILANSSFGELVKKLQEKTPEIKGAKT
ncbi:MAG: ABC transporter substrate-binding protein [Deltaproteobacteria bacterium]|nr:ABC transporter substrate-binding protein [Deltaproteobacteria bacterium]